MKDTPTNIAEMMVNEYINARKTHGPMNSAHEGYAVILEEVDELWDEVRRRFPERYLMFKEALQVGAMAIAFILEVVEKDYDEA